MKRVTNEGNIDIETEEKGRGNKDDIRSSKLEEIMFHVIKEEVQEIVDRSKEISGYFKGFEIKTE